MDCSTWRQLKNMKTDAAAHLLYSPIYKPTDSLGIHAHIFAPNKIQRRGSGLEIGWRNFFVRPAPNTAPPPSPYLRVWMTGPTPTFLKIWICHCRGRTTLTFVDKMNDPLCIRSWWKLLLARTMTVDRSDWHRLFGRHVAHDLITKCQ